MIKRHTTTDMTIDSCLAKDFWSSFDSSSISNKSNVEVSEVVTTIIYSSTSESSGSSTQNRFEESGMELSEQVRQVPSIISIYVASEHVSVTHSLFSLFGWVKS